jgi:hypothetical protein
MSQTIRRRHDCPVSSTRTCDLRERKISIRKSATTTRDFCLRQNQLQLCTLMDGVSPVNRNGPHALMLLCKYGPPSVSRHARPAAGGKEPPRRQQQQQQQQRRRSRQNGDDGDGDRHRRPAPSSSQSVQAPSKPPAFRGMVGSLPQPQPPHNAAQRSTKEPMKTAEKQPHDLPPIIPSGKWMQRYDS